MRLRRNNRGDAALLVAGAIFSALAMSAYFSQKADVFVTRELLGQLDFHEGYAAAETALITGLYRFRAGGILHGGANPVVFQNQIQITGPHSPNGPPMVIPLALFRRYTDTALSADVIGASGGAAVPSSATSVAATIEATYMPLPGTCSFCGTDGQNPPGPLMTGLQGGDRLRVTNLNGIQIWRVFHGVIQSSGPCPAASWLQFTNNAGAFVPAAGSSGAHPTWYHLGEPIAAAVPVPNGATQVWGVFTDSAYFDNDPIRPPNSGSTGGCHFTLTKSPGLNLCAHITFPSGNRGPRVCLLNPGG